jgi:hypothetical protein
VVSRQALISYRGNRYSVPPELAGARVSVTEVLGSDVIDVVTASGITIARHRLAADGTGVMVRDHGHVYALEQAAMAGANTGRPHRRKERIPPGPQALAAAAVLRSDLEGSASGGSSSVQFDSTTTQSDSTAVLYDLSVYERAARGRNTLS